MASPRFPSSASPDGRFIRGSQDYLVSTGNCHLSERLLGNRCSIPRQEVMRLAGNEERCDGCWRSLNIGAPADRSPLRRPSMPTPICQSRISAIELRLVRSTQKRRQSGQPLGPLGRSPSRSQGCALHCATCRPHVPRTCFATFRPPYDATVIDRLRKADADDRWQDEHG